MFQRLSLTLSLFALTSLTAQECCDLCGPETIVVSALHRFGRGVGYRDGYTSLDFFYAPAEQTSWGLPFVDVRGHVFDNGKWAANAGLGWRYLGPASCWVYGANVYYDYRRSHENNFNQVSFGLEALSANWELRANGYVPVGLKHHSYRSHFSDFSFFGFTGNNILIQQTEKRKFEQTMAGLDAEVGYHIWNSDCFDLYAGIGPYYFHGEHKHKNAIGGKVRVTAEIGTYVTLEVSDTWDEVFHNRPQGTIALNIPFGPCARVTRSNPDCCECPELLLERLYQPVEKQEIIVLSDYTRHFDHQEFAIDPATNLPWFVLFVNNTSTDPVGTFENPFNMLIQAQNASSPGNIIYVFPGDGTTTGMDGGILLKNDQRFWGSGVSHKLPTTRGVISLLPETATPPVITNLLGDGVDLAMNNEVVGFKILGSLLHGVAGTDVGTLFIADNDILLSGGDGLNLQLATASASVLALRNNVSQNGGTGFGINCTGAAPETITLDLEDNTAISNNFAGIEIVFQNAAKVNATLKNNDIEQNTFGVFFLYNGGSSLIATVDSNRISNNFSNGIFTQSIFTPELAPTAITMTVTNNQIDANFNNGVEIDYSNNTVLQASFNGNSISDNRNNGFALEAGNVDITSATNYSADFAFTNNAMRGNAQDGILTQMTNGPTGSGTGQVKLDVLGNDLSGQLGGNAIRTSYQGASSLDATIENNLMSFCGNDGLLIDSLGKVVPDLEPASLTVTVNNNQINSEAFNGVEIECVNNTLLSATVDANTIEGNFRSGVAIGNSIVFDPTQPAAYQITLAATQNQMQDNGPNPGNTSAIAMTLENGASGTANATMTVVNNTFAFNQTLFVANIIANGVLNWNVNYSDNTSIGATGMNVQLSRRLPANTGSSTGTAMIANNTIDFPQFSGINLVVFDPNAAAPTFNVSAQVLNNTIRNGSNFGIAMDNDGGFGGPATAPSSLSAHLVGNTLVDNTKDFEATLFQPGGTYCLFLKDNSSSNGYELFNLGGTFTLDDAGNNTGPITTSGFPITPGTCP